LPEETSKIARAADEPPKPSDVEELPGHITPTELAEQATKAAKLENADRDAGDSGIVSYFGKAEAKVESEKKEVTIDADVDAATILKHGESEAHQDLREYARLAAWELPLLHSMSLVHLYDELIVAGY
jgi:hypothetical protein